MGQRNLPGDPGVLTPPLHQSKRQRLFYSKGTMISPKDIWVLFLVPAAVALFGKRGLADVMKVRVLKWGDNPTLSRWALNVIANVHVRGRLREI